MEKEVSYAATPKISATNFDSVAWVCVDARTLYERSGSRKMTNEQFAEKMQRLTTQLEEQFAESVKLEEAIRENFRRLGL